MPEPSERLSDDDERMEHNLPERKPRNPAHERMPEEEEACGNARLYEDESDDIPLRKLPAVIDETVKETLVHGITCKSQECVDYLLAQRHSPDAKRSHILGNPAFHAPHPYDGLHDWDGMPAHKHPDQPENRETDGTEKEHRAYDAARNGAEYREGRKQDGEHIEDEVEH